MTHARMFGEDTVSFDEHDVFFPPFFSFCYYCFHVYICIIIIIAAELISEYEKSQDYLLDVSFQMKLNCAKCFISILFPF